MEHFHLKGDRVVFIHAFDPVPMQSAKHSKLLDKYDSESILVIVFTTAVPDWVKVDGADQHV